MSESNSNNVLKDPTHNAFRRLAPLCVTAALLGIVVWTGMIEARLRSAEARIGLLLNCTTGVSEADVLQNMRDAGRPRYLDRALLASEFPGVRAPTGGHGLLYDSYKASELLGNPHVHRVLLVIDPEGQVCGVMFDTL